MKAIKLDTQGYYNLWQLELNGDTLYNVTWKNESPPIDGYFDPKYLEKMYPIKFNKN